jgi:hypothetical protein
VSIPDSRESLAGVPIAFHSSFANGSFDPGKKLRAAFQSPESDSVESNVQRESNGNAIRKTKKTVLRMFKVLL